MAKIELEAFVEPWNRNTTEHPAWGMKTAESHRRKKDGSEEYETTGRTFRTVKVSRASGIDLLQFGVGDRVKIVGSELTETREGNDGKKYYDLVCWAESIELVARGKGSQGQSSQAGPSEPWAASPEPTWVLPPDDQEPF